MPECIFCRIVAGQAPASIVYRDDRVMAFMDITPINAGHVLVVPLRHATHLADLDPEDGAQMFRIGQQVAAALRASRLDGKPCQGVNLWLCDGTVAFQDVMHVHLHVIPRHQGDGFRVGLPSGYGNRPPRARLDDQAAMLREALDG